jgi:hypothetical protein
MESVKRLWRGEVRLVTTYWVFGFLLSGVGGHLLWSVVEHNSMHLARSGYLAVIIYSFIVITIAYGLFIAVAIWRSANRYTGPRRWRVLAQMAVLLGLFLTVGVVAKGVKQSDEFAPETILQATEMLNKGLPTMVDEITELAKISVEDRTLTYHMRIVGKGATEIDRLALAAHTKRKSCTSIDIRETLANGITVSYAYTASDRTPLTQVIITRQDCGM